MSRVVQVLQQQLAAATATPPASPAEAAFKEQMLPQIAQALEQLQEPPEQLLMGVEEEVSRFPSISCLMDCFTFAPSPESSCRDWHVQSRLCLMSFYLLSIQHQLVLGDLD
jgi:hypothetical protein